MKIIIIIFSPALSGIGILIGDEDYHENADQVVVRIRLLGIEETEWLIQNDCRC